MPHVHINGKASLASLLLVLVHMLVVRDICAPQMQLGVRRPQRSSRNSLRVDSLGDGANLVVYWVKDSRSAPKCRSQHLCPLLLLASARVGVRLTGCRKKAGLASL